MCLHIQTFKKLFQEYCPLIHTNKHDYLANNLFNTVSLLFGFLLNMAYNKMLNKYSIRLNNSSMNYVGGDLSSHETLSML